MDKEVFIGSGVELVDYELVDYELVDFATWNNYLVSSIFVSSSIDRSMDYEPNVIRCQSS